MMNLNLMLKIIRIIPGALTAFFLLLFGFANLLVPVVPESYLDQNTRICIMMLITGLGAVYAILRPMTGGVLLCVFSMGLGFVFGGFFHNPITPIVALLGMFFIFVGYLSRHKLREDSNQHSGI
jgi:hypothetical protein